MSGVVNKKRKQLHTVMMLLFVLLFCSIGMSAKEVNAASGAAGFSGSPSVTINNNVPAFSADEITTVSYEKYGKLDKLGRCTPAMACIGLDLMPTEDRGSIGMVKPTGWDQNKYPGIVDSNPPYLYNRCHMIGFQLTGESANEQNLITGTRYMNIEGMLPFENQVASYIKSTGNHVMYRVTPDFTGENLLCNGVQIEAYSVEDSGRGICFNVYCYNVQPGVVLNYADGSNYADPNGNLYARQSEDKAYADDTVQTTSSTEAVTSSYVANKNTKKFHYPSCGSVSDMKEKNKLFFDGTRDELIDKGYSPCKRCNP